MRTSGTQTTLRSSRSATVCSALTPPASPWSKFMDSSSRRSCRALRINRRGTFRSPSASSLPERSRATLISRSSPLPSSRNPRSAPVTARAASTTAVSTSWLDKEFCSARATSITALSLPSFPPFSGAGKLASRRPTCPPGGMKINW